MEKISAGEVGFFLFVWFFFSMSMSGHDQGFAVSMEMESQDNTGPDAAPGELIAQKTGVSGY